MKFKPQIIHPSDFNSYREKFAEMLKEQGKVGGNLNKKIDRCKFICVTKKDDEIVAIGAIKEKTNSNFDEDKSGLNKLRNQFDWELGYLYTNKEYEGRGIASLIVEKLIKEYGNENLMASTETVANPGMVKILKKNGFSLKGKSWKSRRHSNKLGLFLRFKENN